MANADVSPVLTMADRVLEQLQTAIVKGDMPPGSKISETDLARLYGVSRGPLREAIGRLESRKLLVRVPNVGARVVSLSFDELIKIYQVREALEGMACRLAAETMTPEEVNSLYALLDEHEQQTSLQQGVSYFQKEGDLDFHYRIVEGSHNSTLIQMLGSELYHLLRMYRYQFSSAPRRPQQALKEHYRIVEAIESGDGELAELLMRRHITAARKNIEKRAEEERSKP